MCNNMECVVAHPGTQLSLQILTGCLYWLTLQMFIDILKVFVLLNHEVGITIWVPPPTAHHYHLLRELV